MLRHIPNTISVFRIFLVIPVIYLILKDSWESAFILVLLAGVSDGLDGFLARTFHWESKLGATLDPVADKILLVALFIVLGFKGVIPQWLVILIIARDAVIISGLMLYKLMTDDLKIRTLFASKLNTALLILFVLLHLFNLAVVAVPEYFFSILTMMIVVTTVVSGALYVILWSLYFVKHTKEEV